MRSAPCERVPQTLIGQDHGFAGGSIFRALHMYSYSCHTFTWLS